MSDDELRILAIASLTSLVNGQKIAFPVSASSLLARVVATKAPPGLFPNSIVRFRLTDQTRFASILENLSQNWEDGTISLTYKDGQLSVLDIRIGAASRTAPSEDTANPRKRKRIIDEEADSASGAGQEEIYEDIPPPRPTPLENLTNELREVYYILKGSTAKGKLLAEQFQSPEEHFEPICPHITKEDCANARASATAQQSASSASFGSICNRVHFRPLIRPHTDKSLGHCSYLNTCYSEPTYALSPSIPPFPGSTHAHGQIAPNLRGATSLPSGLGAGGRGKEKAPCRYLHYEIDWDEGDGLPPKKPVNATRRKSHRLEIGLGPEGRIKPPFPPQWINCDVRKFDYSVLGKFHVIMADPPWDIHMSLPYGTMTDDEMRKMPIPALQDEGFLFLWVTGRAMEVGRECMVHWGYTRVDEVVWVKTNQLQRVIRTGRTGHWINHTKEHMLVGIKNNFDEHGKLKWPSWANRGLDTDVIVSEVRETSRKPDEVYGMIERVCPGGRKIEIFGRKHNTRPGWLTLGNQLGPDQIHEPELADRIKARYPDRNLNIITEDDMQV